MPNLLTIKIKLNDAPIKIERTIQVSDTLNFNELHYVVQAAMGWENEHLYSFGSIKRSDSLHIIEDNELIEIEGALCASKTPINTYLNAKGDKIRYTYDFGDNWEHTLTVQSTSPTATPAPAYCTAATGDCPPEDAGGVYGYDGILDALKNPTDPENQELIEWAGIENPETYDPNLADVNAINERLNLLNKPAKVAKSTRHLASLLFGWTL